MCACRMLGNIKERLHVAFRNRNCGVPLRSDVLKGVHRGCRLTSPLRHAPRGSVETPKLRGYDRQSEITPDSVGQCPPIEFRTILDRRYSPLYTSCLSLLDSILGGLCKRRSTLRGLFTSTTSPNTPNSQRGRTGAFECPYVGIQGTGPCPAVPAPVGSSPYLKFSGDTHGDTLYRTFLLFPATRCDRRAFKDCSLYATTAVRLKVEQNELVAGVW